MNEKKDTPKYIKKHGKNTWKRVDYGEYSNLCESYKEKYGFEEEWRPVVLNGKPTRYIISNYGRLLNVKNAKPHQITYVNKHWRATLTLENGKTTRIGLYRLVALMFIPIPQKYFDMGYTADTLVVDHKREGDPDNFDDNTVWNLQWLTYRENISKAANCGYRNPWPADFSDFLNNMILNDCDNPTIYKACKEKYGLSKEELKAVVQVRRRRLGKTLKEHYENDKEFVKKIDKLLQKGHSNIEIIEMLNMPKEGRASTRLLQYRRSLLKIPADVSKYFTNEQSKEVNNMLINGISIEDIIEYYHFDKLSEDDLKKVKQTLRSRRRLLLKKMEKDLEIAKKLQENKDSK